MDFKSIFQISSKFQTSSQIPPRFLVILFPCRPQDSKTGLFYSIFFFLKSLKCFSIFPKNLHQAFYRTSNREIFWIIVKLFWENFLNFLGVPMRSRRTYATFGGSKKSEKIHDLYRWKRIKKTFKIQIFDSKMSLQHPHRFIEEIWQILPKSWKNCWEIFSNFFEEPKKWLFKEFFLILFQWHKLWICADFLSSTKGQNQ